MNWVRRESVFQADLVDLTTAGEPGETGPWEVAEMTVFVVVAALAGFGRRKEEPEEEEGDLKSVSEGAVAVAAGSAGESSLKRIRREEYSWVQRS